MTSQVPRRSGAAAVHAVATLGTPLDVTLEELRVETLFPADAATRQALAARPASSVRSAVAPSVQAPRGPS